MIIWIVLAAVVLFGVIVVARSVLGSERTRHRRAERRYTQNWSDQAEPPDRGSESGTA